MVGLYESNGNISEGTETYSSEGDAFQKIKALRIANPKKIIISYININSIRNKFHDFVSLLQGSVDVLVIAETKLDSSFPTSQFMIPGYKMPYRLDVSAHSGGLLVYVNEQIISKELTGIAVPHDIQAKFIELNLRKAKWLLVPSYRPPSQNEKYFVEQIGILVDFYSISTHNLVVFGDLHLEASDPTLSVLID